MIPKKAGMEPNEIPTTIFCRLVYEPPILTETVVHHPKEPNSKWWQRQTWANITGPGSRFWKFTSQLSTNHLAVKKPEVLGKFDVSSLLPKYPRIRSSFFSAHQPAHDSMTPTQKAQKHEFSAQKFPWKASIHVHCFQEKSRKDSIPYMSIHFHPHQNRCL